MRSVVVAVGLLSGCWYEKAKPVRPAAPAPDATAAVTGADAPPAEEPIESYRKTTIAVDAIGVTAMAIGIAGLQRDDKSDFSAGLMLAGLATAAYANTIIHGVKAGRARAAGSFVIRSLCSTTGMFVGFGATNESNRDQWFPDLTGMLWGMAGGLAIAGVMDAVFLHDTERPRTWMPAVTAGDGGARVGILGAF